MSDDKPKLDQISDLLAEYIGGASEQVTLRRIAAVAVAPQVDESEPTPEQWSDAIVAERARQIEKGYDAAHDREHGVGHLLNWAIDYDRRDKTVEASALKLAAKELIAEMRAFVYEPGNWSALDGRRQILLNMIDGVHTEPGEQSNG